MKLLSSMGGKPPVKDENAHGFVDVEGLNGPAQKVQDGDKETPTKQILSSLWSHTKIFIVVFIITALLCTPSSVQRPNPHPIRHVSLNKTAAGYGVMLNGNRIVGVVPGSSADLSGDIKIDDEITSVNGIATGHTWSQYVIDLMHVRDDDVKMTVVAKSPEVPLHSRLIEVVKLSILPYFAVIFLCFCMFYEADGSTRTVTITKMNGHYGMMVKGTMIYEVTPLGAAETQGQIEKWEEIVRINGVRTSRMGTETILELLETRGDQVTLEVRNHK